ncbi:MAG: twin-arginine translocation signal domain-containing protein, partial [Bacteroidota bacterium]
MKENKSNFEESRRDFLKKASAGLLGAAFLGNIPDGFANSISTLETYKSKVVLVRHSKVLDQEGNVNLDLLAEMLETALANFNDGYNSANLWRKLFLPKDIIGI